MTSKLSELLVDSRKVISLMNKTLYCLTFSSIFYLFNYLLNYVAHVASILTIILFILSLHLIHLIV